MGIVKIEGKEELDRKLKQLIEHVDPDKLEPVLLNCAREVAETARAKAPLGPTGNLKRSLIAKLMPRSRVSIAIAAVDRKIAPHGHLVEFGHGGPHPAPAHPFFRPAWDETRDKIYKTITEFLKTAVESIK
jgi:HK97 gp10 family phage protein